MNYKSKIVVVTAFELEAILEQKIERIFGRMVHKYSEKLQRMEDELDFQKKVFTSSDMARYMESNRDVALTKIRAHARLEKAAGIDRKDRVFKKHGKTWVARREDFEEWYLNYEKPSKLPSDRNAKKTETD